ncbi:hypothetical protein NDU88_002304 [Pleurodeles waltl]|uniref:Uncharacterized protein n=1 Tax=Pleurodeles waltl TaxID=8319 RepID=A0AAV7NMQ4_PLEWA|nr:hypothetical protein NDU88_002304 [Pleurodeles waltl]
MVTGGARQRRPGKDISSSGPAGWRSLTRLSKLNNKSGVGSVKDATENGSGRSSGALIAAQAVSSGLKCKTQPAITDILIKGAQYIGCTELPLSQKSSNICSMEHGYSINRALELEQPRAKSVFIPSQMVETQNVMENQTVELMRLMNLAGSAESAINIDRIQSEYKRDQDGKFADILTEPNGTRASRNLVIEEILISQKQEAEPGQAEGDRRKSDWSKEGRDKFYSLTEDSEVNSTDGTQSDVEDNFSSDCETNLSSAIGPTVKQLQC